MSRPIPFRVALCVFFMVYFLFGEQAYSEEILRRSNIEIELGLATWISQGRTKWSHNASTLPIPGSELLGNPTSELDYKDVWSNIVELHGRVSLRNGVFVRGQFGYGGIDDGKLIDDDYVSASGATAFGTTVSGPHRFSRTESDIDGSHLWYLNADLGFRLLKFSGGRGSIHGFVGYQYWKEKYVAKGLKQLECTALTPSPIQCAPAGTVGFVGQTVITNEVEWSSIRLGLEGGYQFTRRFSLDGSVAFIPYTSLDNQDIHHLRTDLRQDPSFSMSGTGIGANFEVKASYMIVKQLFFDLGYRYWWLRVTDGDWKSHPVGGPMTSVSANLNEFQSIRQGVTLGLTYIF
ncbi:MAG: hypothetical protein MN733_13900 [Nitrososphaera sp.]|nr:hypothetical protein [Nitrososphaera sp.]